MVIVGVRLCWLNQWNDFVNPGRPACTFVFLCSASVRFFGSIQCEVIVSPSLHFKYTKMAILVELMKRFRWPWANSKYVCIPVCLILKFYSGSIQYKAKNSHFPCTTITMFAVHLFWLNRWNYLVGPGRTGSTFVFLGACLARCNSGSMGCEVLMPSKYYTDDDRCAFIIVGRIGGTTSSALHAQMVDLRAWMLDFGAVIWFRSIISSWFPCRNIPHLWWSLYLFLGWIDGMISLAQRTVCTFGMLCTWFWWCDWDWSQCEAMISP